MITEIETTCNSKLKQKQQRNVIIKHQVKIEMLLKQWERNGMECLASMTKAVSKGKESVTLYNYSQLLERGTFKTFICTFNIIYFTNFGSVKSNSIFIMLVRSRDERETSEIGITLPFSNVQTRARGSLILTDRVNQGTYRNETLACIKTPKLN